MDYGNMPGDSFSYAKDAIRGKWFQWILLAISTIMFPHIMGYAVHVYNGVKPALEIGDLAEMFIDGIKLLIIGIIYPVLVFMS